MAVPQTSSTPTIPSGRPEDATVVAIYDLLLIVGFIVCTAVLLTAVFSKRIIRSRQWYIFMGFSSWWAIQHQLLIGNQLTPGPPPHALCLLQSSLIYAAPPATTFCLLCIFIQLFLLIIGALKSKPRLESLCSPFLVGVPFVTYICVFIVAFSNGMVHPDLVVRDNNRLTCHLSSPSTMYLSASLVLVSSFAMIIIEALTLTMLWKNYDRVEKLNYTTRSDQLSLTIVIRTSIFSLLPIISFGMIVSMLVDRKGDTTGPSTPASDLAMATLPLSAGIIYGTQKDIMATWIFWRRAPSPMSLEKLPHGPA